MQSESPGGLHVAIIMDGNGRWAAQRGMSRIAGHHAGVAAVRRVVERAPEAGVRRLTLYAFSSDNWRRPAPEVQGVLWLLRTFLHRERERLCRAGVRLEVIGRRDRIPKLLLREIVQSEMATAEGRNLHLRVAIDYSSRVAIAHAAATASAQLHPDQLPSPDQRGSIIAEQLSNESHDVDLLIRTGGEKRLSDFLLWECAYAELIFTDRMWPDFAAADLDAALEEFRNRERRFGGVPAVAPVMPELAGGVR
jgi:undecaprenyl diphosphate synthase